MESIQSIKKRVKAVNNIAQITKAMEMVSANKMRRSQETALNSRPYAISALELLHELSRRSPHLPSLMQPREVKKIMIVLITSDKGLAGSLNSNVLRYAERHLNNLKKNVPEAALLFAAVGKKAEEFLTRKNITSVISFTGFGDYSETTETKPLADFLMDGFESGEWDRVIMIGTHFRTTLRQDVLLRELLPISEHTLKKTINEIAPEYGKYADEIKSDSAAMSVSSKLLAWEYLTEPTPESVLETLSRYLVEMSVYHLMLEANASEHSARMVAMKNASDNAGDLEDELSLLYNKSRQAGITREIAEISAGAESLGSSGK